MLANINRSKPTADIINISNLTHYIDYESNSLSTSTTVRNLGSAQGVVTLNNGATITNIATRFKRGTYGASISGGSTQYVSIPSIAIPDIVSIGDGFSINFWFKLNSYGNNTSYFYSNNSGTVGGTYMIRIWGNTSNTQMTITTFGVDYTFNVPTLNDSNWHMLTLIHAVTNVGTSACTVTFYFDNVSKLSTSSTYPSFLASRTVNYMGGVIQVGATSFDGFQDEFRFYTRPITTTEINALFTNNPYPN